MPHFYFHVENGDSHRDERGTDLSTLAEAKCAAVRYAGRLLCDRATEFWDTGDFSMSVTDESGLMLFTLQFSAIEAPAIRASG